ncbi:hypothetical protein [Streptomyces sp. FH025]|uniref:hypothetical protein n=1 Tax=Streptomyces sp. FH025 TaxID=2815937 RepID=UPI001A9F6324|nr:hypothetical protein [Streptomyces sp. FH025]MBO1413283.1 hypothetical protein [Streptomyces sp. FH025]
METGNHTKGRRKLVVPGVLGVLGVLLLLLGMLLLHLVRTVATEAWRFEHGRGPIARHDKPGTDAGQARDSIQSALEGAVGAITPQVAHSDGWYYVVRAEAHWDGEPRPTSTVYRTWSLQARIDRSKYQALADQLAQYWRAHGYNVGPFQNSAGANTGTFLTDERHISATSPDGVLITLEMDTPGVSLEASLDGVQYAGTEVYGENPARPGRGPDFYSQQLMVAPPTADDPYWSHG